MANLKISQLPSASAVTSDDLFPIVDSGSLTTQRASGQQVLNFITGSAFNTLNVTNLTASSVTGSSASFTTISASNYLGLPTTSVVLPKLVVSSSVLLTDTQRAVFAKNSDSSSVTITLPSVATADSREYYIIKADNLTGSITVSGSSPDLINGASFFDLNGPFQSITLIVDGINWFIF